jgi:hypothetical protein
MMTLRTVDPREPRPVRHRGKAIRGKAKYFVYLDLALGPTTRSSNASPRTGARLFLPKRRDSQSFDSPSNLSLARQTSDKTMPHLDELIFLIFAPSIILPLVI